MNTPLRGWCSRPGCWNRATGKDKDGRLVCRPDCHGGSGLGDLPPVRLEDLPPIQWSPPKEPRPMRARPVLRPPGGIVNPRGQASQTLLAVVEGLDVDAIGKRLGLTRAKTLCAVANLRRCGLLDKLNRPTPAGKKRAAMVRALLAEGGAP